MSDDRRQGGRQLPQHRRLPHEYCCLVVRHLVEVVGVALGRVLVVDEHLCLFFVCLVGRVVVAMTAAVQCRHLTRSASSSHRPLRSLRSLRSLRLFDSSTLRLFVSSSLLLFYSSSPRSLRLFVSSSPRRSSNRSFLPSFEVRRSRRTRDDGVGVVGGRGGGAPEGVTRR